MCCTFSCRCNESILYVVNSHKQHTKAFNVWTCLMWLSIPLLDPLTSSHWGHPYLYPVTLPASFLTAIVIGDSHPPFSITDIVIPPSLLVPSPSPSFCSSFGSCFIIIGVRLFRMLRNICGSSPAPISPSASSYKAQPSAINFSPSATIRCPLATVLTATIQIIILKHLSTLTT